MAAKLYLIPNAISEDPSAFTIPEYVGNLIGSLRLFFVEDEKSAHRLLKKINPKIPLQDCEFQALNEHTPSGDVKAYLERLLRDDAGIISEQGCPCVADPGANLVWLAHQNNIEVVPLVGPSSIILALMASGLNGQNFAFNGYLPKDRPERSAKIKTLEKRAAQEGQSQIFMETPYRNQNIFAELLNSLSAQTKLCVACDISGQKQFIHTKTVEDWRKSNIQLPKRPALFILKG